MAERRGARSAEEAERKLKAEREERERGGDTEGTGKQFAADDLAEEGQEDVKERRKGSGKQFAADDLTEEET